MSSSSANESPVTAEEVYEVLSGEGKMSLQDLANHFDVEPAVIRQSLRSLSEQHRIVWGSDFEYRTVEK